MIGPALIGAGGSLLSGILNNRSQRGAENRSRQWSEQMYQRQYDDNLRLWNMQNAYNDPKAQMERLRAAGLNPMLMYGKGAGAGAAGQAGEINTPDVQDPTFRAPTFDFLDTTMSKYFSIELASARANKEKALAVQESGAADIMFGGPATIGVHDVDGNFKEQILGKNMYEALQKRGLRADYFSNEWKNQQIKTAMIDNKAANAFKYITAKETYENLKRKGRNLEADLMLKQVVVPLQKILSMVVPFWPKMK